MGYIKPNEKFIIQWKLVFFFTLTECAHNTLYRMFCFVFFPVFFLVFIVTILLRMWYTWMACLNKSTNRILNENEWNEKCRKRKRKRKPKQKQKQASNDSRTTRIHFLCRFPLQQPINYNGMIPEIRNDFISISFPSFISNPLECKLKPYAIQVKRFSSMLKDGWHTAEVLLIKLQFEWADDITVFTFNDILWWRAACHHYLIASELEITHWVARNCILFN